MINAKYIKFAETRSGVLRDIQCVQLPNAKQPHGKLKKNRMSKGIACGLKHQLLHHLFQRFDGDTRFGIDDKRHLQISV